MKAVNVDGRDVTGRAIELRGADVRASLVFTDRPTELSGFVRDERGQPSSDSFVYVFPAGSDAWVDFGPMPVGISQLLPDARGFYRTSNLPPGDYLVSASKAVPPDVWQTTTFLRTLVSSAARVKLGASEHRTVDLTAR